MYPQSVAASLVPVTSSGMDHGSMDHGSMDHGSMDHGSSTCKMNMVFTWSSDDLCIIFEWWHVRTGLGLFISLLTIVGLTMGYEYYRNVSADYLLTLSSDRRLRDTRTLRYLESLVYALQVCYSFFLMLIFMTFNGWTMVAMGVGAFLGHYLWGCDTALPGQGARTMACH
ncbi:uncharacterized protein V1510DRAFT_419043 [Dipodascopsis tothii]|uniref:uncharacterized protein n=1 Tax=Dipodascopsis tothii TaxID=44089 RepID=UPI0034CF13C0